MEQVLSKDTVINGELMKEGTTLIIEGDKANKVVEAKTEKKKIKESEKLVFSIVYVNSMDSVVVELNKKNFNNISDLRKEAHEQLLKQDPTASDDFWIDDVWTDSLDISVDWKDILAPAGVLAEDLVSFVFENPKEFGLKMEFIISYDGRVNPKTVEEDLEIIECYDGSGDSWIGGNHDYEFPEGWLETYCEGLGWITGFVEGYYVYCEEALARAVSDEAPNGTRLFRRIGDYFLTQEK